MKNINASQALSLVALVGVIVLFSIGRATEAEVLIGFIVGHILPSPVKRLNPTPSSERVGVDE